MAHANGLSSSYASLLFMLPFFLCLRIPSCVMQRTRTFPFGSLSPGDFIAPLAVKSDIYSGADCVSKLGFNTAINNLVTPTKLNSGMVAKASWPVSQEEDSSESARLPSVKCQDRWRGTGGLRCVSCEFRFPWTNLLNLRPKKGYRHLKIFLSNTPQENSALWRIRSLTIDAR